MARQSALKLDNKVFDAKSIIKDGESTAPVYVSSLGALFAGDCMAVLPSLKDGVVDTVFADPPFNLGKKYGKNFQDRKPDEEYLEWCKQWIAECVRTLKPGGAFFIYNLPKWNVLLGAFLSELGMDFRHWIAVEISACLPIPGRLHPSHYSLLYYTKGRPKTFRHIRTPIQTCRHCGKEIKDYGGHRHAMNPKGVNLKDVWSDIPPVRHWKFKSKERRANALSTKILDRVVELSTFSGNLVLDPFGGSGTTFAVCEKKGREWIGIEIDFAKEIIDRLESGEIHSHKNRDYVED
ncbi:MAG TPA: site-specific DNA-methyltransferase [Candidatus Acidoferrales bacterium]